ncbi:LCP family protein [Naumannella halotolerans]|uniref:LCP family protein n=1 Tax=Naumannella halotolerans TaxID=993414 RepID=UPI00370D1DD8
MNDNEGLALFDEPGQPARSAGPVSEEEPQRRRGRPLLILLGIALALVLIVGGVAAFYVATLRGAVDNFATEPVANYPDRPAAAEPAADGSVARNYVLIGTDAGSVSVDDPGRSDALLLAHVPADKSQVYLISIPRDLYAEIPGYEKQKITHAYAYGGMNLTVQSVETLFDVRVDHAASVDFQSFADLTTALGGVTVENTTAFQRKAIDGTQCDYPEGEITIEGPCALQFARERKKLPNGDLSREENHRLILQAIMRKTMSPSVLANPAQFRDVVYTISRYVSVDSDLNADVITDQALEYRNLGDEMTSLQAPITGFGRDPRTNASIAVPDEEKMAELSEALQNDTVDEYVEKYPEN